MFPPSPPCVFLEEPWCFERTPFESTLCFTARGPDDVTARSSHPGEVRLVRGAAVLTAARERMMPFSYLGSSDPTRAVSQTAS